MRGKLIQKSKDQEEKKFRVMARSNDNKKAGDVDIFSSLEDAIAFVDNNANADVSYYVHTDSNRVLYYK